MHLHIVADENIPRVDEAFGALGRITLLPGGRIDAAAVRRADVLLVRSVTRVDAALLEGSTVRFVGSATIGTDHVDIQVLQALGIAFAHAPGSNAESVVEYVLAALLHLAVRHGVRLQDRTVGVVGCGHIGGQLAGRLPALGLRVLRNDPPLAAQAGPSVGFVTLGTVLAEADVVTLHVPLTTDGPYATHHLVNAGVLDRMKPGAWLINTSRGPVASNAALGMALGTGHVAAAVLDVWEGEPTPDPALLRRVDLGTPHIAGYSYDGKIAGTRMLYDALTVFLDVPRAWNGEVALAPTATDRLALFPPDAGLSETAWLRGLVRQMYDIADDDRRLRDLLELTPEAHAAHFTALRKHYPRRRAFARHRLAERNVPEALRDAVRHGLGVQVGY